MVIPYNYSDGYVQSYSNTQNELPSITFNVSYDNFKTEYEESYISLREYRRDSKHAYSRVFVEIYDTIIAAYKLSSYKDMQFTTNYLTVINNARRIAKEHIDEYELIPFK